MKSKYINISALILLLMSVMPTLAQKKNVDAAWRLAGKTGSLAEARKLINEAMNHPQTSQQARTYYVAAMIEWRSYEADVRKREINPKDGSVTDEGMNTKLMSGYKYLQKALPLDSLPDKKGKINPKFSKDILDALDQHAFDLYRAGAVYYNSGKYFPQAYEGFLSAAELASNPIMRRSQRDLPDSLRGNAYFFAGLSAYGGKQPLSAVRALSKAEQAGFVTDTLYLYSLAIWEQLARDSVLLRTEATDSLLKISTRAYNRYGISVPEFLSRLTQINIATGDMNDILLILNNEISKSPDHWLPRGLRGWVFESQGNIDAAVADYKLAAEHPDISAKMLMRAAHTLYRVAHARKEEIKGSQSQRRKLAAELINNYLTPAADMAKRAKEKTSDANDLSLLKNILEAIDYDISLLK